ncbi:hypothetical protein FLW53_09745 [Microbispora sp. SCL1-1]|uniref:hypothetical protein n=1 Tax=unclassified Microbispora TaxID=2614687 RepID=UPI00115BFEAC|nr:MULTISPECIES: hypothetical protein [unclassified Microbispora]NJP24487.1 hypothetical protein [Microbispora sp. CL1-1]TQS14633.1 hypothetical protein FLW53_09745 [Microbispora sp. SCL1-1]
MTPLLVKAVVSVAVGVIVLKLVGPATFKLITLGLFAAAGLWAYAADDMGVLVLAVVLGGFAVTRYIANPN